MKFTKYAMPSWETVIADPAVAEEYKRLCSVLYVL